ncbi:MAG: hypothetical protein LBH44_07755 [Treponema sp.]|jgi:hypothetical protein|nr:hypothetical protein [Treponema sp.]
MKPTVLNLLLYLWQLPQHLVALVVWEVLKCARKVMSVLRGHDSTIIYALPKMGLSLGRYIFVHYGCSPLTIKHEMGHSRQSLIFGPFYLLLVGIPSAVFANIWDRLFHKKWSSEKRHDWYYNRYPEKWADKLGGVDRISLLEKTDNETASFQQGKVKDKTQKDMVKQG